MRKLGKIVDWNDNRGFGFIVPEGGGDRVFVHIKAFRPGQARPRGGETVDYIPTTDDKDRRRADDVVFARRRAGGRERRRGACGSRLAQKRSAYCSDGSIGRLPGVPGMAGAE